MVIVTVGFGLIVESARDGGLGKSNENNLSLNGNKAATNRNKIKAARLMVIARRLDLLVSVRNSGFLNLGNFGNLITTLIK